MHNISNIDSMDLLFFILPFFLNLTKLYTRDASSILQSCEPTEHSRVFRKCLRYKKVCLDYATRSVYFVAHCQRCCHLSICIHHVLILKTPILNQTKNFQASAITCYVVYSSSFSITSGMNSSIAVEIYRINLIIT